MAFVDLEKAFDRVPREVVWWTLACQVDPEIERVDRFPLKSSRSVQTDQWQVELMDRVDRMTFKSSQPIKYDLVDSFLLSTRQANIDCHN